MNLDQWKSLVMAQESCDADTDADTNADTEEQVGCTGLVQLSQGFGGAARGAGVLPRRG